MLLLLRLLMSGARHHHLIELLGLALQAAPVLHEVSADRSARSLPWARTLLAPTTAVGAVPIL